MTDAEHEKIMSEVCGRMIAHAETNGWGPGDVKKETLILACPFPEAVGSATIHGIELFLSIRNEEEIRADPTPVLKAQSATGFVIMPGIRKVDEDNALVGELMEWSLEYTAPATKIIPERIPNAYSCFHFVPGTPWMYTIEDGWTVDIERSESE